MNSTSITEGCESVGIITTSELELPNIPSTEDNNTAAAVFDDGEYILLLLLIPTTITILFLLAHAYPKDPIQQQQENKLQKNLLVKCCHVADINDNNSVEQTTATIPIMEAQVVAKATNASIEYPSSERA